MVGGTDHTPTDEPEPAEGAETTALSAAVDALEARVEAGATAAEESGEEVEAVAATESGQSPETEGDVAASSELSLSGETPDELPPAKPESQA